MTIIIIDNKVITADLICNLLAKAWMHTDEELVALAEFCREQIDGDEEERPVLEAFAQHFESKLKAPPPMSPPTYAGPKPKFENHCKHPFDNYAGEFKGADLYFYLSDKEWNYCLRRSDLDSDYSSGPIIHVAHEFGERQDLALLHRFFQHTQVHRCR